MEFGLLISELKKNPTGLGLKVRSTDSLLMGGCLR